MTDHMRQANRRHWDAASEGWEGLRDQDQLWRVCIEEPSVAFVGDALQMIGECCGDLGGQRVCVVGSGDNYAAFALAGMGARVTSTDISTRQLQAAARRAAILGLDIEFVRCDAVGLDPLADSAYDLVCSTNGFWVWIDEPHRVFCAVSRVLKPGGHYVMYDVHPFQRPWRDQTAIEMVKPYWATGPFVQAEKGRRTYEFHWTLADIVNSLLEAGLVLRRVAESGAKDSRFWEGPTYAPGTDDSLLDWRTNPRAGLPSWLTLAAQRP
ncbi:MAG: class I SAM-dependent methyltransferase [Chloroflexi bacterium]|nr:class I SAM-dependent methyltransferase [Chloroflexota bacterium]